LQPAEKERVYGTAQKCSYTLLRVLLPMELSRFRSRNSKIYSQQLHEVVDDVIMHDPHLLSDNYLPDTDAVILAAAAK
jgi:hypothetical protein